MIFTFLTGILKFPFLFFSLLCFMIFGLLGKILILNKTIQSRFFTLNTHFWCKLCIFFGGFKIVLSGNEYLIKLKNREIRNPFILSNHLSYWDILILSSLHPLLFITSREMQKTPFLGQLAELGGSFFVERRNPAYLHQEILKIADVLKKGFPIVLFPEGTTSDGKGLLPFKKSLLACAVESGSTVLPVTLKYSIINGIPTNDITRDQVCWYGNMSFFPHLMKMLFFCRSIEVEISFSKPISLDETLHPSVSRKILAQKAYDAIEENYFKK